jgi:glycosyltransferase involved in cell wall biosynthesis
MRIVQLVTTRQRRGAEVFASQLSDGLIGRGHEVKLVGLRPPPPDPLVPSLAEVEDVARGSGSRLSYGLVLELGRLIRRLQPDLVQANGSVTLKYAAITKRWSGGSWPLVYRNISMASYWIRRPGQRWWGRWLLRSVDHVAAVSELSGIDFGATYGLPGSRISTIPIGVEIPSDLHPARERARLTRLADIPDDSQVVIHVASFTPEKNHEWLIQAFGGITQRNPRSRLLLVGDGPLRPGVEAAVAAAGLDSRVRFLGTREDVPQLLTGSDLLVLPSRIEGISGVILEAAAQGIPTVATAVGGVPEAVKDGATGRLVAPGDMEGFVSAVGELLDDPAQRLAMGERARAFARERYAMDGIVGRFEQLYSEITARQPSRN